MTDRKHHHPPHDHPDFDAYLDTLTDEDHAAINTAIEATTHGTGNDRPNTHHDLKK